MVAAAMVLARLELGFRNGSRELAALLAASHHQDLPARRARRVGPKPHVHASDVEDVAALRQNPDLISLRELPQADGALRSQLGRRLGAADAVCELGERLEYLLLDALVGGGLSRAEAGSTGSGAAPEPGAARHG